MGSRAVLRVLQVFSVCLYLLERCDSMHKSHHHRIHVASNDQVDTKSEEMLALQHNERVSDGGSCDQPRLQIVHVSDHYPDEDTYFLPHCTLLHRCGRHAGCCGTERLRCAAETKKKITLQFFSVRIKGLGAPPEKKIEHLTFTNHTKCGCVPVGQLDRNDL